MTVGFKFSGLVGIGIIALTVNAYAQTSEPVLEQVETTVNEEQYVPRKPTQAELKRYALIKNTREKWNALFDNPKNAELHWEIAKNYLVLGNGDIALHELKRAETLNIERSKILVDLGNAYLLNDRYEDVFTDILLEDASLDDQGEIYLIYGRAHFALNNNEQAYINLYQAQEILGENRLELIKPMAALYSLMGEYEKAERLVGNALIVAEKDPDLLVLKGELVHRQDGAESSYKYFERADFYRPYDVLIQSKLAGALYNLNRRDEAMSVLRKILEKQPKHPYANFMIATLFAEGNNIRTATRFLNQAGDVYNEFIPGLLLRSKLAFASGSYQKAEISLLNVLKIEPENGEARRLLGTSLMHLGKYEDAVTVLRYLVDHNRLQASDYFLLGSAFALNGNNDKATEFLKQASDDDLLNVSEEERRYLSEFDHGDNFGVSLNVGRIVDEKSTFNQRSIIETYVAMAKGKYQNAVDLAAGLIDKNRQSPIGFNLLGLAYLGQDKLDEARSNFLKAIELDTEYNQAKSNLAKLELDYGSEKVAMANLNSILSQDESYVPAYEVLYEDALYQGDLVKAEEHLMTAVNANPGLVPVYEKLINFYFNENEISKAKSFAMQMVEKFPDHPLSYKALGRINLSQNDYGAAIFNFETALSLLNSDEEIYLMLSKAYVATEQLEQAKNLLKGGLVHVKKILPLQRELIEFAQVDGDFVSAHHFADQLKIDERTKAEGYLRQGELNLLENRAEDAINSFLSAAKSGANQDAVQIGLDKARSRTPAPMEILDPVR